MFFDPDHFFVDFFRQCTLCCFSVHIAQEGCYIRVKGITFAFRVQEDLCRKIPQLQTFLFDAAMAEGIHGEIFAEGVEGTDEDDDSVSKNMVPFQIAYAVSIHKAQGLEYDSVKIIITDDIDELITHSIFYTAITRAREKLKIYWTQSVEKKVLDRIKPKNNHQDISLLKQELLLRK